MRRTAVVIILATLLTPVGPVPGVAPAGATNTPILAQSVATQEQARAWARAKGAPTTFQDLVPTFWAVANARGVRPDLAYAQSAKETDFGRFTGVVPSSHNNPCGIKITAGGSNGDPAAHASFPDWITGITACVDHLALYAGAPGYPRAGSPDPRHFAFILGTAPTAEALGGRWAPSLSYGTSIVQDYLLPMIRTQPSCRHPFHDVPSWVAGSVTWAFCDGHMEGFPDWSFAPNAPLTRGQLARLLYRIAGSPDVSGPGYDHPFTDVAAWVDDAVRWIAHDPDGVGPGQAHATGYPGNLFKPNDNSSRAEVTRMLYRIAGSPDVSGPGYDHPFTDVAAWVDEAVRWIAQDPDGVGPGQAHATGYPGNLFKPDIDITRAQITRMVCRIVGTAPC
jgi:hypothetical protein